MLSAAEKPTRKKVDLKDSMGVTAMLTRRIMKQSASEIENYEAELPRLRRQVRLLSDMAPQPDRWQVELAHCSNARSAPGEGKIGWLPDL